MEDALTAHARDELGVSEITAARPDALKVRRRHDGLMLASVSSLGLLHLCQVPQGTSRKGRAQLKEVKRSKPHFLLACRKSTAAETL